jgi:hypothetical protein
MGRVPETGMVWAAIARAAPALSGEIRYVSKPLLGPPAPDHDAVLDVVEALGMRDLVRTEALGLGLVYLLSHALLFGGGMAVNHIVEPGSGHLETADTVAIGVNPALFGSVLFWIEISHVRILLFLHRITCHSDRVHRFWLS